MDWPFIRRAKIAESLTSVEQRAKKHAEEKNAVALETLREQLTQEHEIELAEKDAEIASLRLDLQAAERSMAEARTVYYQSKKDSKKNTQIAALLEKATYQAEFHILEGIQLVKNAHTKAKEHRRGITGRQRKDLKKLGLNVAKGE